MKSIQVMNSFYTRFLPKNTHNIYYYTQKGYISHGFIYYCLILIEKMNAKLVKTSTVEKSILSYFGTEVRDKLHPHWINSKDTAEYHANGGWLIFFSSAEEYKERALHLCSVNYSFYMLEKDSQDTLLPALNITENSQYVILEQNATRLNAFARAFTSKRVWNVVKIRHQQTVYWVALDLNGAILLSTSDYKMQKSELQHVQFNLNSMINNNFSAQLQLVAGDIATLQLIILQLLLLRQKIKNWGYVVYYGKIEEYQRIFHSLMLTQEQISKLQEYLQFKFVDTTEIKSLIELQNDMRIFLPPLPQNSIIILGNFTSFIEREYAESIVSKPLEELVDEIYHEKYEEIIQMFTEEKREEYIQTELEDIGNISEATQERIVKQLHKEFDIKLQVKLQNAYNVAQHQALQYRNYASSKQHNKIKGKYTAKARKDIVNTLLTLKSTAQTNDCWIYVVLPMKQQYRIQDIHEKVWEKLPDVDQFYQSKSEHRFEFLTDKLLLKLLHAKAGVFPAPTVSIHHYSIQNNRVTAFHRKAHQKNWSAGWWAFSKVQKYITHIVEALK